MAQGSGAGSGPATPARGIAEGGPARAGAVLGTLILVAAIANLPLAVANVALPDIGLHFDASQTQLNLVAVGYSLGLAASVLWLGALGDRYGRKSMLLLGVALSLPACLAAAWAPSIEVLIAGRVLQGCGGCVGCVGCNKFPGGHLGAVAGDRPGRLRQPRRTVGRQEIAQRLSQAAGRGHRPRRPRRRHAAAQQADPARCAGRDTACRIGRGSRRGGYLPQLRDAQYPRPGIL